MLLPVNGMCYNTYMATTMTSKQKRILKAHHKNPDATLEQIGQSAGISPGYAQKTLKKHGITKRTGRRPSHAAVANLVSLNRPASTPDEDKRFSGTTGAEVEHKKFSPQEIERLLKTGVSLITVNLNEYTLESIIEVVQDDKNNLKECISLAGNRTLPEDAAIVLAASDNSSILVGLGLENHYWSARVVETLYNNPHQIAREIVTNQPMATSEMIDEIAKDTRYHMAIAYARTTVAANAIERVGAANNNSYDVHFALASNPTISAALTNKYLQSSDVDTRETLAAHTVYCDAQAKLAKDPNHIVRRGLTKNPYINDYLLNELVNDPNSSVRESAKYTRSERYPNRWK